jgi:ArsR family transcriptional regulator
MQISASPHETLAAAFKAVADPTRVRILATVIAAGELCVCHVEQALGVTQSRASRHLAMLKRAGLVVDRRDGAWVHYGAPRRPGPVARAILAAVRQAMADDPATATVAARAAALRDRAAACGGGAR